MKKLLLYASLLASFACSSTSPMEKDWKPSDRYWPWDTINTQEIDLPEGFLTGAAICEFQNSGETCEHSSWNRFQHKIINNKPTIAQGHLSGKSCDHWNNLERDITLMKDVGLNSFRFSVDWGIVEPEQGNFNEDALDHYFAECQELLANGITPMVTLHHFNLPNWFEGMGGFAVRENISYFVRFSKTVFEKLSGLVPLWCTINEPNVYAFQSYYRGVFPPAESSLGLAYLVLANLLEAHVEVYKALKAMTNGDNAQIGLVHQYLRFEPYTSWNPLERVPAWMLNALMTDTIFTFLTTGTFEYSMPCLFDVSYKADVDKFLDFIGINYYTEVLLKGQISLTEPIIATKRDHQIMTDMPYPLYAEGLYHAIAKLSELGVPMHLTELGIADAKDDRRDLFFKQTFYAISQAINDGYDVRSAFIWTLMDNFEWDMGWEPKFGLYEFNPETQEIKLRAGTRYFSELCNRRNQIASGKE